MLLSAEPGNINSVHWAQVSEPSGSGILVKVHYASLTPIDGKKATGAVSHQANENCYGMDYSGVTESGIRVMGIVHRGACQNYLRTHPDLLWPVPDHWSLEDAATVPLAYAYAFYCLTIKAKLYSGMKILIHEGAGALGQAAIAIALAHKCQVFTTVGDVRTKSFLEKLYPELKEQHIGNSRDMTFGDMVLSATNGKGCDVVICNVEPWLKHVSLQCGGALSIIIDTAQIYNQEKFEFRMNSLINDRSYVIADFSSIFDFAKNEEFKKLQILVSGGISKGYVRPLGRVTYAADEAPRALRLLSKGWHRGHVLLRLTDRALPASPRNLKSLGVNVIVSSNNLKDLDDVATVLKKTIAMGPVEGVYVTSFKDMDKYTSNSLEYLDAMSRKFCPFLKYFAVITNSENFGKKMSIFRAKDNLIISRIEVQRPDFCGDTNTEVLLDRRAWDLSLLDAVETGLCFKLPLVVAQINTETSPLYQQLADVADLPLLKEAGDMTTLQDLAAGSDNIKLIKEFLRLKYHVCISEHNVLKLNKQKLREIDFLANNFEHKQGLAVYFSHIAEDELSSDTPIYLLPTLGNANAEKQVDALKSEYLCVVPGIEGHHVRFRGLCERLKLPALVLQPSLNVLHETIEQAAQSYSKILMEKIGVGNNFYLLGCDIGILIAMELAAILERNGFLGTIFCLGTTPEDVKPVIEQQLGAFSTEDQLQLGILKHIFTLLTGEVPSDLDETLDPHSSWNEKIDACIKMMAGRITQTKQYVKALINFVYERILSIKQYESSSLPILKSRVVILRSPGYSSTSSASSYVIEDISAPLCDAAKDV
ncbi:uncharacterized protein LOC119629676 isoform X2 [Bombyx mori]|uniref:uncharacterized protein LOC119629676 isoform X2 n=1 Tax=Bombyx mori TaxID=7091 RepID=UPI002ED39677